MKKVKLSRSKQKCNSDQLEMPLSISKIIRQPYGTGNTQLRKKDMSEEELGEQEKCRRHKYEPLDLMERKEISRHIKKGFSLSHIATLIQRGKNSVIFEVRRNGGRDNYDPIKAHELSLERKAERHIKCSGTLKGKVPNPYQILLHRIENLEMQMEIIIETLKDIKHGSN